MDVNDEQTKSVQADLSPIQASVIPHGHGSVCSLVKPTKVVASTTPTLSVVAPQKRNTTHGQFAYATLAGCGERPRDALDLTCRSLDLADAYGPCCLDHRFCY